METAEGIASHITDETAVDNLAGQIDAVQLDDGVAVSIGDSSGAEDSEESDSALMEKALTGCLEGLMTFLNEVYESLDGNDLRKGAGGANEVTMKVAVLAYFQRFASHAMVSSERHLRSMGFIDLVLEAGAPPRTLLLELRYIKLHGLHRLGRWRDLLDRERRIDQAPLRQYYLDRTLPTEQLVDFEEILDEQEDDGKSITPLFMDEHVPLHDYDAKGGEPPFFTLSKAFDNKSSQLKRYLKRYRAMNRDRRITAAVVIGVVHRFFYRLVPLDNDN